MQLLKPEFLKVTVSQSCNRAKFYDFAQNLEICMRKFKKKIVTSVTVFFFMFHTYKVIFSDVFALFP